MRDDSEVKIKNCFVQSGVEKLYPYGFKYDLNIFNKENTSIAAERFETCVFNIPESSKPNSTNNFGTGSNIFNADSDMLTREPWAGVSGICSSVGGQAGPVWYYGPDDKHPYNEGYPYLRQFITFEVIKFTPVSGGDVSPKEIQIPYGYSKFLKDHGSYEKISILGQLIRAYPEKGYRIFLWDWMNPEFKVYFQLDTSQYVRFSINTTGAGNVSLNGGECGPEIVYYLKDDTYIDIDVDWLLSENSSIGELGTCKEGHHTLMDIDTTFPPYQYSVPCINSVKITFQEYDVANQKDGEIISLVLKPKQNSYVMAWDEYPVYLNGTKVSHKTLEQDTIKIDKEETMFHSFYFMCMIKRYNLNF